MIDVQALRIGNYLLLEGNVVKVEGIPDHAHLLTPGEECVADIKKFEPIPITEELYLKLGFKPGTKYRKTDGKRTRYTAFTSDIYGLSAYTRDGILITSILTASAFLSEDIKYMHDLQNKYFAITGKELDISEKSIVK